MIIKDFLSDSRFALPQKWWDTDIKSQTVSEHLEERFKQYLSALRSLVPVEQDNFGEMIRLTQVVVDGLTCCMKAMLIGQRSKAYRIFRETCDEAQKGRYGFPLLRIPDRPYWFRARKSKIPLRDRGDLFHIPFDQRHKVASQRYSVPGLPCLYFGTSLYACWTELGCPPFADLHFSRFQPTNIFDLKIVNLNFTLADLIEPEKPDQLHHEIDKRHEIEPCPDETLLGKIIWWPLLAACSMMRKNVDAPFHEEYLFPQLFMEYITEHPEIHGVSYFCCKPDVHGSKSAPNAINELLVNVAIPVRTYQPGPYCRELQEMFHMTDPLSWQIAESKLMSTIAGPDMISNGATFRASVSCHSKYAHSLFNRIEMMTVERGELTQTMGPLRQGGEKSSP